MSDAIAEFRDAAAEGDHAIDAAIAHARFIRGEPVPVPRVIPYAEQAWRDTAAITRRYLDAIGTYPPLAPFMLMGLARIAPDDDFGTFALHPEGQPAVITPIRGLSESNLPASEVFYGDTHDLIAWHPAHDWAYSYYGAATIGCAKTGAPIMAHRSIMEWFRAGCEGVVILRW